jgi:hypothetical protein
MQAMNASDECCGVASAALVASALGRPLDASQVDALASRAVTLGEIEAALETRGCRCLFVSHASLVIPDLLDSDEAAILYLPPSANTTLGHALVAIHAPDGSVIVLDPSGAHPEKPVSTSELCTMGWKGDALVISVAPGWLSLDSILVIGLACVMLVMAGFLGGRMRKSSRSAHA